MAAVVAFFGILRHELTKHDGLRRAGVVAVKTPGGFSDTQHRCAQPVRVVRAGA